MTRSNIDADGGMLDPKEGSDGGPLQTDIDTDALQVFVDVANQDNVTGERVIRIANQVDRNPYAYFSSDLTEEDLAKVDQDLQNLRDRSQDLDRVPKPDDEDFARIGTGAFLTNHLTADVIRSYGENGDLIAGYMQKQSGRRYWGDTDVRGCLFAVLSGGINEQGNPILSAMHIPYDAASDRETLERMVGRLVSPFSDNPDTPVAVYLAGGYEEEESVDTIAASVSELTESLGNYDIKQVDVLGRSGAVRRPVFDTKEGKLSEIQLFEEK